MRLVQLAAFTLFALSACRGGDEPIDHDGDGFPATTDCDDDDATVNPGADERCDGRDNDCDGDIDEAGAVGELTWYADADADSFGDPNASVSACEAPDGYVGDHTDCDDAAASVHPGAPETCNGVDDDCDGDIDENAIDQGTWYADGDADGYGSTVSLTACEAPEGYVATSDDCDDADAAIHPGAVEDDCTDPVDYNCDGAVGYVDGDGDGFAACEDCDDTSAAIRPDATEICDGVDNDCDGEIDEQGAAGELTWYADADADTFGDPDVSVLACAAPSGYVADKSDCDDAAASVHPGAPETCNEVDDDCDGDVDENAIDASTWHADADGDGYGGQRFSVQACARPDGYQASNDDCDDLDPTSHPGATEVCDGSDNDCDGVLPDDEADADADGHMACAGDCADDDADVFPGAPELCNGQDDDCDGHIDNDPVDEETYYADLDGDGFGGSDSVIEACEAPDGFVTNSDDCDDDDAAVHPHATEVPDNSVDDDCDGNQPPEPAPLVAISPRHPGVDGDLHCQIAPGTTTTDPDGDPVTYEFSWSVDSSSWLGSTATTDHPDDTIDAADTLLGQKWTCEVTATDGVDYGTPASATVTITEWLQLSAGKACNNWSGSGVTQVHCGDYTPSYAACVSFCADTDPSSMVHWGNQNGDYVAWGSVIAVSYELCDDDTTCDDANDDNFWSRYSTSTPQEYCTSSGARMTCGSSWWTSGTSPTRCFCYR